jgi:hypothetical protein
MIALCVRVIPLCILLLWSQDAFAWGRTGHRVVALIAEERLSPRAKEQVAALLAVEGRTKLWQVATWADKVKRKNGPNGPMHTVRLPLSAQSYDATRDCPKSRCVVAQIESARAKLANPGLSELERLEALKYLVHFVGDIHQPLHASMYLGRELVSFSGQIMTLHVLWDAGVIDSWGTRALPIARALVRDAPPDLRLDGGAAQWAEESRDIVRDKIYRGVTIQDIRIALRSTQATAVADDYPEWATPVIKERLLQAGLRLAEVLNDALK